MDLVRSYVHRARDAAGAIVQRGTSVWRGPLDRVRTAFGTYATTVVRFYSALFYDLLKLLLQMVVFATLVALGICVNVVLLYLLKWIIMPPAVFSSPVYFDYRYSACIGSASSWRISDK